MNPVVRSIIALCLCGATALACGGDGGTSAVPDAGGTDDVAVDATPEEDVVADDATDGGPEPDVTDGGLDAEESGDVRADPGAPDADVIDDPPDTGVDATTDGTPEDGADTETSDGDADADAAEVGPPLCDDRGPVTLGAEGIDVFYWPGDPTELGRVAVDADIERCGPLQVLTEAPWLHAAFADGALVVSVDPDGVSSGRHAVGVSLTESGGSLVLARLPVNLRALLAPADASRPRALFIGVDGMRPDGMMVADTPTFDVLRRHAAWTLDGTTQLSSVTDSSAGWTALMTGVDSDKNGVTDNGALDRRVWDYPTFAWRARHDLGLSVALTAQWAPFAMSIHEPDASDFRMVGGADFVTDLLAEQLRGEDRDLYVIHLDDVDHAGHASGFSPENPAYLEAITGVDALAGRLLDAILDRPNLAEEDWLIVVTTDHGGVGTGHGGLAPPYRRVPFIFAGPTRPVGVFVDTVIHMDVFPTILAFLGTSPLPAWDLDGTVRAASSDEVAPPALPGDEAVCDDGIDDDNDGDIDCRDGDCDGTEPCPVVCADADLGSAVGEGVATGSNEDAATEYVLDCARLPGGADVSWTWTTPSAGEWVFDTFGSSFDTMLGVFDGECASPADRLVCNDDSDGLQSRATVVLDAGQVVSIVVAGFDGRTGDYVLNVTGPL